MAIDVLPRSGEGQSFDVTCPTAGEVCPRLEEIARKGAASRRAAVAALSIKVANTLTPCQGPTAENTCPTRTRLDEIFPRRY